MYQDFTKYVDATVSQNVDLCWWNHGTYKNLLHRTFICVFLMVYAIYVKSYLMHSEPVLILRSVSRLTSLQTWFRMHSEPFFSYFSGTLTSYIWVVNLHRKVPLFIHLVWASSSRSAVISGDTMWQTWLIWSPFLDVATWSLPSRKSSVMYNVFYYSRELFFLTYER
jgi:hypothetical protein